MRKTIAAVVPLLFAASGAQATFIAGWDFGQYAGPGAPTTDGVNLASEVKATYSDFDPTFGAGAESTAFGSLWLDGTAGSSPGAGGLLVPTSDAISLLQTLPQNNVPVGDVTFDSGVVQVNEGTTAFGVWQDVSMISQGTVDVVFQVDSPGPTSDWFIQLAGLSFAGGGTIDVAWSSDGAAYNPFTTLNLGTTEQAYLVDFGGTALDGQGTSFVRLSFNDANLVIDNVGVSGTVSVPEPSVAILLMAGLAGLARAGRARA